MSFEYMDEFINIYKVLMKDECEEVNKYLEKNPKIRLRLLWFSDAKDLNFLENIPNTKALSIEYSSIENIDALEKLPKLSILSLEENENKIEIEIVKKLTNLTSLNLNFKTKLRQTDLSVISNLKNLKEFYFSGKFKKNSLNLNHIPNLEIFSPLMSAVNTEQLGVLTKLKYLKLSNQKIETLEYLEKLISIKKVFLNNIKIANQDVLVDLFNLPQLETLGISYVKNIIDFQFTKDSSSIKELILWSLNDLKTYKGIERLSALKKLSHCGNHKNPNTIDFNSIKLLKSLDKLKIKVGAINNLKKKELKNIFDELKI